MINHIFLLDVAPEPVTSGVGVAGLVFVALVVFMGNGAIIVGLVLLVRAIRARSQPVVTDQTAPANVPEFQPSSPNQA